MHTARNPASISGPKSQSNLWFRPKDVMHLLKIVKAVKTTSVKANVSIGCVDSSNLLANVWGVER